MTDIKVNLDALNQMVDMGIPREGAREALLKSKNDVGQAIESYFDNSRTDPEETTNLGPLISDETDNKWNVTTHNTKSGFNDSSADPEMNEVMEASKKDAADDDLNRALSESMEMQSNKHLQLVLYNENKDDNDPQFQKGLQESYSNNSNFLTDPEQPMKRMKLNNDNNNTPVGLRPTNGHHYVNSFIQALFYIPVFRLALLSFRPTRDDWGEVEGYWKGRQYNLTNEPEYLENGRQPTLKFIHEFQKLFGFLSLSQRSYGDSSLLLDSLNLNFREGWEDYDEKPEFTSKFLDALLYGSIYLNRYDDDKQRVPDKMLQYVLQFNKLFRSFSRNEVVRNMPLEITSNNNTVYAALDEKMRGSQKILFSELAHILTIDLKYRDMFNFSYSDSSFQIHKELYMDRYLLHNSDLIEKKSNQIEVLKRELERTGRQIDKIIKYQGKYNGSDLLKCSSNYFKWKHNRAEKNGEPSDDARRTAMWLDDVLERVEQKLKVLLEKRDEYEQSIKKVFDTPDMKKHLYRLKAVLVCDGQMGQGHHWAYIWVPRDGKNDSHYSSTLDDGSWMKFCDTNVEQVHEDVVLNEGINGFRSNIVHALIYVDHQVDFNFPNIMDVIPASLKEFVDKDNCLLEEEIQRQYRSQEDMSESTVDQSTWGSDSTTCGTSESINRILEQAISIKNHDPAILKRIELFAAKLGEIEIVRSLIDEFKLPSPTGWDWNDPICLKDDYLLDPRYTDIVKFYKEFKYIALYIIEGLEQSFQDQYIQGLGYFYRAIEMEKTWIQELHRFGLDGTNLERSEFMNKFAKAFLKILNDGALEKAHNPDSFSIGVEKAFQVLKACIYFRFNQDEFIKEFLEKWVALNELIMENTMGHTNDQAAYEKLTLLLSAYKSCEIPHGLDIPLGFEEWLKGVDQPPRIDDDSLVQRYTECLRKCKVQFRTVMQDIEWR